LELARAREEVCRLSGQLKEVRASNAQLEKDLKESVEERRRLTQEVLELRAAEERLMPMERIEKELEESSSEVERLRRRGAARSDTEPLSLKELRTEQLTPQLAGAAMKDGAKPGRMLGGRVPEAGPAGFKLRPGSWNAAVLQG
jgi:predicted RNase H-like nuclease (RuvC/YqgF family)